MYLGSVRLALKLYPFFLAAVFGELFLRALNELGIFQSGGLVVSYLIWSILACYAHMAILLPEKRDGREDLDLVFGFAWRNLGLTALFFVPALAIVASGADSFIAAFKGEDDQAFMTIVGGGVIPVILIFLLVYGLLGTILPAFITGRNKGMKNAFRRGCRFFFPVMGRLIIGPGFIYLGLSTIGIFLLSLFQVPEMIFQKNWVPNFSTILSFGLIYCIHGWAVIMIAWILSHSFLASEADADERDPAALPDQR